MHTINIEVLDSLLWHFIVGDFMGLESGDLIPFLNIVN